LCLSGIESIGGANKFLILPKESCKLKFYALCPLHSILVIFTHSCYQIAVECYLLARQKAHASENVTDISSSGERGKRKRTTNIPASFPKKIRKRKQFEDNLSSSESDTNDNNVSAGLKIRTLKSPNCILNNVGETLQTFIQSAELIKVRQKQYDDLLEFLSSQLDHMPQCSPENSTQAIKLPLRTMIELDELERAMTNDDIEAKLYGLLFGIVGNIVGDTTRNCLAKLVSNNVAANLNWKGRGNKQGGNEKQGRFLSSTNETNIEKPIKDWLQQAPY
ncbi:unnamed protein product, partial [Allacma fusca]